MKKAMLVSTLEGVQVARFYDDSYICVYCG